MNQLRLRILIVFLILGTLSACSGTSFEITKSRTESPNITSNDEAPYQTTAANPDSSITVSDEILSGRNISLFDNGGYVKSCQSVHVNELEDCLTRREAARKFIFDHWTQKHRGYVQIGQPCSDCLPVDHIFVEPDADGTDNIIIASESNGPLRTQAASSVKYRKASAEEKQNTDSATILVFLDSNGNEIDYF